MTAPPPPSRFRTALRAVAAVVAFFLLGLLLFFAGVSPLILRFSGGLTPAQLATHPPPVFALIQGIGLLLAFGAATWLIGVKLLRLGAADLRWRVGMNRARAFALGLLLGALPAVVAMVLGVLAGGAAWVQDRGGPGDYAGGVLGTAALLAPAALAEEVMFRGVPLVVLARLVGRPAAIVGLAVLFSLAHLDNPDVSARAIGNIALAGILLSLAFYTPGGMWAAFGAHLGWNATLAALGAPVSGLPFDIPYIDYSMGGPAWLTGGSFGPEGGVLGTAAITGAIVVAARWARKDVI
ncbi:MAG: CPBP family intramembrane glutamic endopeptidase [Gemmatimonadales bacterium]